MLSLEILIVNNEKLTKSSIQKVLNEMLELDKDVKEEQIEMLIHKNL